MTIFVRRTGLPGSSTIAPPPGNLGGTQFAKRLDVVVERPTPPPPACPKCKSDRTKIIGTSSKPMLTYAQCDDCGHVYVPDDKRS
jgi:uncharacterized OB-fold protein